MSTPINTNLTRRDQRGPQRRTVCKYGHPFTEANTLTVMRGNREERRCRQCHNKHLQGLKMREGAPKLAKRRQYTVSYALTKENRPQRRARKVRERLLRKGRIAA